MLHNNVQNKPIYLKTFTLRDIKNITEIKSDIEKHMILIIRITPLAQKDVDDLRIAVEQLYKSVRYYWWGHFKAGRGKDNYNST